MKFIDFSNVDFLHTLPSPNVNYTNEPYGLVFVDCKHMDYISTELLDRLSSTVDIVTVMIMFCEGIPGAFFKKLANHVMELQSFHLEHCSVNNKRSVASFIRKQYRTLDDLTITKNNFSIVPSMIKISFHRLSNITISLNNNVTLTKCFIMECCMVTDVLKRVTLSHVPLSLSKTLLKHLSVLPLLSHLTYSIDFDDGLRDTSMCVKFDDILVHPEIFKRLDALVLQDQTGQCSGFDKWVPLLMARNLHMVWVDFKLDATSIVHIVDSIKFCPSLHSVTLAYSRENTNDSLLMLQKLINDQLKSAKYEKTNTVVDDDLGNVTLSIKH